MTDPIFALLSEGSKEKIHKAWHQSYKCTGIKHCEYAHEDVLRICSAYDKVELSQINDLRKRSSRRHVDMTIFEQLNAQTEAYFNAFMINWKQDIGPCQLPSLETQVCQGQSPRFFLWNGVCICSSYILHMLILSRYPF